MLGHGSGGDAGCLDRFGAGYTLDEVGHGVRVACARRVDLTVDRDGRNMLGRLGRDDPCTLRAERQEYLRHAQGSKKPSSYRRDQTSLLHLLPVFGKMKLREVTSGAIQRYVDRNGVCPKSRPKMRVEYFPSLGRVECV